MLGIDSTQKELDKVLEAQIEVVDAAGTVWPLAGVVYDESAAQLTYQFGSRLPTGTYTVRMPKVGGLKDLSGLAPRNPIFRAGSGVLATFAVAPRANPPSPDDLGQVFPDPNAGVTFSRTLDAGASATLRVVVPFAAYYRLTTTGDGSTIAAAIFDATGAEVSAEPSDDAANALLVKLAPGVYRIRLDNAGDSAATVSGDFRVSTHLWESLLANGVAQGSALNLRLVTSDGTNSPTTRFDDAGGGSASAATGPSAGPYAAVAPSPQTTNQGGTTQTPGPSAADALTAALASRDTVGGLALAVGGGLVGRPSAEADHVAAVGPASGPGEYALAYSGNTPGQALAASGSLLGFAPSDDLPETPGPILDGTLPPIAQGRTQDRPRAEASEPQSKPDQPFAEPAPQGEPLPSAAEPEALAAAVPVGAEAAKSADPDEAEEEAAGFLPWLAAAVGATAVGARWMKRRRSTRRDRGAVAAGRMPSPHVPRVRSRVENHV